jgi:hypothetical protein
MSGGAEMDRSRLSAVKQHTPYIEPSWKPE